jgi:hypothetical protein
VANSTLMTGRPVETGTSPADTENVLIWDTESASLENSVPHGRHIGHRGRGLLPLLRYYCESEA